MVVLEVVLAEEVEHHQQVLEQVILHQLLRRRETMVVKVQAHPVAEGVEVVLVQ
jgi:hypothetical protein